MIRCVILELTEKDAGYYGPQRADGKRSKPTIFSLRARRCHMNEKRECRPCNKESDKKDNLHHVPDTHG
jgi:hypothetical protein